MANKFREDLKSGRRLFGTHVNMVDYRICDILGRIGFDYIWIDMEHMSTSFQDVERNLIACKANGTPSLVRVSWNDVPHIKRVVEMGPDAIVVPMVNSVEEARFAIDNCIYPSEGKRGFGPCRAIGYGVDDVNEYLGQGHKEMLRFLQVETEAAVEIMEQVAEIPYMDGFVIGPMDLSGSVGALGRATTDKRTNELIAIAVEKAHKLGKPIGLSMGSYDPAAADFWIGKGVDFISMGLDMGYIIDGAKNCLSNMRAADKKFPKK